MVPSVELLDLQRRVLTAIGRGLEAFPHQDPGSWTGHVTLARRLTTDQLAGAVQLLSPADDVAAHAASIRRWDGERKIAWTVGPAAGTAPGVDSRPGTAIRDQLGEAPMRMPMK